MIGGEAVQRAQPAMAQSLPSDGTLPPLDVSLQPTLEESADDFEVIISPSVSSSVESSTIPSRDEVNDETDLTGSSLSTQASLARRDFTNDLARSLWGIVGPKNFGLVLPGIYRSSYPKAENLPYLRTIGLKTILTLVPEELPEVYKGFIVENNITHYQIGIEANKDPKIVISSCKINAAIAVILQKVNHPILIHCNKGKHRTGTVVGCMRKVLGADMDEEIISEYRHYAGPKARYLDEKFIEQEFDQRGLLWLARQNGFLPPLMNDPPRTEGLAMNSVGAPTTRLRG